MANEAIWDTTLLRRPKNSCDTDISLLILPTVNDIHCCSGHDGTKKPYYCCYFASILAIVWIWYRDRPLDPTRR